MADSGKGPKIAGISIYLEDLESAGHGAENPFRRRFKGVSAGGRPGTRGLGKESRVRFSQASWPGPAGHSQDFGGIPGFPAPVAARGGGLFCGPPASRGGGGCFADASRPPPRKPGIPGIPPLETRGMCTEFAGDHGLPRDPGIHLKTGGKRGVWRDPGNAPGKPRGFTEFLLVEIRFPDQ